MSADARPVMSSETAPESYIVEAEALKEILARIDRNFARFDKKIKKINQRLDDLEDRE